MYRLMRMEDLPQVDYVFRLSAMSIQIPVLMYSAIFALYFFYPLLIFNLAFFAYVQWYIFQNLPSKHLHKYQSCHSAIVVLLACGQIIGFTSMELWVRPEICWVSYFFIHPSYQGKGYGLLLNNALFDYAYGRMRYTQIMGATSLFQWRQISLQKKYVEMLNAAGIKARLQIKLVRFCQLLIIYT